MKNYLTKLKGLLDKTELIDVELNKSATINNMILLAKDTPELNVYLNKFNAGELTDDEFISACTILLVKELIEFRKLKDDIINQNW
ncbi:hypothetical protein PU088_001132 [Citrobacter farmeri]|nr:hypothetical protein [Citrobacter farmeri]